MKQTSVVCAIVVCAITVCILGILLPSLAQDSLVKRVYIPVLSRGPIPSETVSPTPRPTASATLRATASTTPEPTPSPTSTPEEDDRVLIAVARNHEICMVDLSGLVQSCFPAELGVPCMDRALTWSPDGAKIAFSFVEEEGGSLKAKGIYVADADGSNPVSLTTDYSDREPAWSPDGTKIAFSSSRDGPSVDIYVMNADGSNPIRLTFGPDS